VPARNVWRTARDSTFVSSHVTQPERTDMSIKLGILALLDAKPERGDDLAGFLEQGRAIAAAEEGTVTWYAFKLDETTYGIFDTFESEAGRQAHIDGEIPKALGQVGDDLLAKAPEIRPVEIVAVK
jgi:quinol monooxygenase YgiN